MSADAVHGNIAVLNGASAATRANTRPLVIRVKRSEPSAQANRRRRECEVLDESESVPSSPPTVGACSTDMATAAIDEIGRQR